MKKENMSTLKLVGISAAAIVAVIAAFIFGFQGVQNKAIALEESVLTAKSDISVQEKRRVDLLKGMVDTIEHYDAYEAATMREIIEARSGDATSQEYVDTIETVSNMIDITTEAYPELKASENYKTLMLELATTENLIAGCRDNYNSQVAEYNKYVKGFPRRNILSFLGYEVQPYERLNFEVSSDAPDLFE